MKATPTEEVKQVHPVSGPDLSDQEQAIIDWLAENTEAHVSVQIYFADDGVRWRIPERIPKQWIPNVADALVRIANQLIEGKVPIHDVIEEG